MHQIVWISRHGNRLDFVHPDWFLSADRPFDPPLSGDGIIQAQELGQRLQGENITHIFASPFLRTVQTAYQVAEILDLPIKIERGLSEWLNPEWMPSMPENLSIKMLRKLYPRIDINYTSRVVPKYPEVKEETCWERAGRTAQILAAEFSQDILLVGHGASVFGAAQGLVGGMPQVKTSLCCLVKIVRYGEKWQMELNGDNSHLTQKETIVRLY